MRCPACDADNPAEAAFCDRCGVSLAASCPVCGHQNRPESRFCQQCGVSLTEPQAPGPGDSTVAVSLAPTDAIRPAAAAPRAGFEGERKPVTVLFCEIVDAATLAE